MGAILDTLMLGPSELLIIKVKYPQCVTLNLTESDNIFQEYRIIIGNEDESNYYDFLVDNHIALSSNKFYFRLKNDKKFGKRMISRMNQVVGSKDNCSK